MRVKQTSRAARLRGPIFKNVQAKIAVKYLPIGFNFKGDGPGESN